MENNKITVKQILDMATKYQFSDWRLEGARTGKSICQINYRSSVVNEYYEKIVASIYRNIYTKYSKSRNLTACNNRFRRITKGRKNYELI